MIVIYSNVEKSDTNDETKIVWKNRLRNKFSRRSWKNHGNSEATGITIPFDVEKVFGAKRVPVKVSINGAEYRSTIMRMDGRYMMAVPKNFRDAANIKSGETIRVAMEKDDQPREIEVPSDLAKAIDRAKLKDVWEKLSYTNQKEFARAVEEGKRDETKARRIEKTIKQLISKRK